MRGLTVTLSAAVIGIGLLAAAPNGNAQVRFGVNVGPAPECPYGYYDVAPYNCAPYGYYGPEWFNGDAFVGAGPWYRGDEHFHGRVDNRFHPDHGYHGELPHRGDRADRHIDGQHFRGNETRDGRGHTGGDRDRR